jgi:hypothetical protein
MGESHNQVSHAFSPGEGKEVTENVPSVPSSCHHRKQKRGTFPININIHSKIQY